MHRAPALPRAECDRPARHMEQREHADGARPARGGRGAHVGAQPVRAVRQHDAFGPTGAPAGEEDHVRIALVEIRGHDRVRGTRRHLGLEGYGDPRREFGALIDVRRTAQQQARLRVCGDGCDLVPRRARVQRREHRTDLCERREHGNGLERGLAPPQHPITPPDPDLAQAVRDAIRLPVDLTEGQRVVVERGRDGVGRDPRRVVRASRQCGAPPQYRTAGCQLLVDNDCC